MALFHFHVTQIKRSAGQSAVASAAYRAGEKIHSDYYGEDSDYTHKGGVICSEILLPSHAPPKYADRETLWNAVEKAERGKNAQLAYSFDIALQNELSLEENISLARQYLLEQFVSRGMIVDFAVHQPEKDGGISNPHFHVMCPIRPLKEDGRWDAKQHRQYLFDENGNPILDDAGHQKFNAVPTTDWGTPETLEHWRKAWADLCNSKFAEKGLVCRIDHRSYEAQGVELMPTVHEGPSVRQMEAKGIRTDKGDFNRFVKSTNAMIRSFLNKIAELTAQIKELIQLATAPKELTVIDLLNTYFHKRNAGAYSQKAKITNLKQYASIANFLQAKNIVFVSDLEQYLADMSGKMHDLNASTRKKSERIKELQNLVRLADDYIRLKPIVEAIPQKGGFGKKREKYISEHDSEIRQYHAVKIKLDKALPDKKFRKSEWQTEIETLQQEYQAEADEAKELYLELKQVRDIQMKVNDALHDKQQNKNREWER